MQKYPYSYDADLYNIDTMPNGEENRCRAITRKGHQCKNVVFQGQIGHGSQEVVGYVGKYPAFKPMVEITKAEYEQMIAGVCYIHSEFDKER